MKKWLDRVPRTTGDFLRMALGVALIFGLVWQLPTLAGGLGKFFNILSPFAWGIVLAYVLDIPTRFFAEKLFHGKRGVAVVLSYILLFGVVALLLSLVVPQLAASISSFVASLSTYEEDIQNTLTWVQQTFGIDTATLELYVQQLTDNLQEWFKSISGQAAQAAADAAAGVAGAAMDSFVTLAVSIYLLGGKDLLLRAARTCLRAALPPKQAGSVFSVCTMANRTFSGYIGGQLMDALLVGVETFVLMSLFRLDYAPLIAVLVGVTNIIPVLGPFIGAVPGTIILLLESPLQAVEFVLIILVVQQVDGNFIAPRIIGGATGLPGLGVLMAIIVGGNLFGIPGMVIGVPTLAVIVTLIKQAVGAELTARGIDEEGRPLNPPDTKN
ncbi:AI-2E family transporter [uncultured Gemmiger sp.]|uniref:AI-2E family transporter n=1 Tax=Subdoligranulum variabile TaxID=214851 RepID=A0A921ILJ5_9FIRM|nr:AI-2E family transporter [uncultured Gemmiger sp.]HJG28260.1 AI-2E family transporter [Subdoligranulum variabile]